MSASTEMLPAVSDAQTRSRPVRLIVRLGKWLVVPVILVGLWQAATIVGGEVAFAGPSKALQAAINGISEGWMLSALWETVRVSTISFLLSATLGLILGVALGLSRFWGDVFEGPMYWVYSIPKITLYPVFLLLFGLTVSARVSFAVFHGFIPLVIYAFTGVRSIHPVYTKVAQVYRMSSPRTFARILFPAAMPSFIVGLRYCFSLTFLGVIVAEMFASTVGMGSVLMQAMGVHRLDRIFAIGIVLVLIALIINSAFLAVEARVVAKRREGAAM